jgi:GNAT superfamily N-acetyltransferase
MDSDFRSKISNPDIEEIVRYHAEYYNQTYGFNHEFGEYVRKPLTELVDRASPRERIWLIGEEGSVQGCVALAEVSAEIGQLRWYYVDESVRGRGLGSRLMTELIVFALEQGYRRIILWTVSLLEEARRMYERHGFVIEEELTHTVWGMELTEQKYVLILK